MENYSHFELTLGGLFILSTSFLVGSVCKYIRTPNNTNENNQQHSDEIEAFRTTMKEASLEKDLFEHGLEERFKKLDQWNSQKISSPEFFKTNNKNQITFLNKQLQELHNLFITSLHTYPELNTAEAMQVEYITVLHRQWREHHANVGIAAANFFIAFDEYLSYLDNSTQQYTLNIV